ncbi:MAG: hypothetical protein DME32_08445 [Verrucomicrobia bacterium]|nr:MAG: hypothetical protein DME32_08445 [Verrucomicrobiota bacterium]
MWRPLCKRLLLAKRVSLRNRTTGAVRETTAIKIDDHAIGIEYEPNDIYVLRISGTLKQSEFAAEQADIARRIDSGSKPRVLVIGEKFEGWERGADWNDLDFMISHGGEIAKIAIVAEPRWEVQALAFAGAGVRRAPVRFFPPDELSAARAWLTG